MFGRLSAFGVRTYQKKFTQVLAQATSQFRINPPAGFGIRTFKPGENEPDSLKMFRRTFASYFGLHEGSMKYVSKGNRIGLWVPVPHGEVGTGPFRGTLGFYFEV